MKALIVLHGALGASAQLQPLAEQLKEQFTIHTLNFDGHGGRAADGTFSIARFAGNLKDYIQENNLSGCPVFGYSMGRYVALKLESMQPGTFSKIVTLGTKFGWTPEVAEKETAMLNPEKIEEKVPKFAAALQALHAPLDWKEMMHKTADMMRALGSQPELSESDFAHIQIPVSLLLGSEDVMVTKEETQHVLAQLPNATFTVVEGWQHPIERVNPEELAEKLRKMV